MMLPLLPKKTCLGNRIQWWLGAAARELRMLLSLDLGFADIRMYPPGSHPGIIVFRPASLGFRTIIQFATEVVSQSDLNALAGCVVVAEPGRTRVRWPKEKHPKTTP